MRRRTLPDSQSDASSPAPRGHDRAARGSYAVLERVVASVGLWIVLGARALLGRPESRGGPESDDAPRAMLNGLWGDRLESSGNPLAISMELRVMQSESHAARSEPLDCTRAVLRERLPGASRHVVVWVHGLCMSERGWCWRGRPPMGDRLSHDLGVSSVYLRYNTGRRVARNGIDLCSLLERLVQAWPVPVSTLTLVGHSMGGLVIRSATSHGQRGCWSWTKKLRSVICLGTPHHGSGWAKAGHWLARVLHALPYAGPLAFTLRHSAGIQDLREGDVTGLPLAGTAPTSRGADPLDLIEPAALVPGVRYFFAAATVGAGVLHRLGAAPGDLLVGIGSALGRSHAPGRSIALPPESIRLFRYMNHFDLLHHPAVYAQVRHWAASALPRSAPLAGFRARLRHATARAAARVEGLRQQLRQLRRRGRALDARPRALPPSAIDTGPGSERIRSAP